MLLQGESTSVSWMRETFTSSLMRKGEAEKPLSYPSLDGGKRALMGSGNGKNDANRELLAEIERLKKLIGELTIANDSFKKILESTRGRGSW